MKVPSIVLVAIVAAASVNAVAGPKPAPEATPEAGYRWCYRRGQPCAKLKRAVETISAAIDEAPLESNLTKREPGYRWCYRRGQPCAKAKRDLNNLSEAAAQADSHNSPAPSDVDIYVSDKGLPPDVDIVVNDDEEKTEKRSADPGAEPGYRWCYRRGQPCAKVKRAAEAFADAMAEPTPEADAEAEPGYRWCYRRGQPCAKAKRGLEILEAAIKEL